MKNVKGAVKSFFDENKEKFGTKRQASKYLNEYGKVYKAERGIDLGAETRGNIVPTQTPKSATKKVKKIGKK